MQAWVAHVFEEKPIIMLEFGNAKGKGLTAFWFKGHVPSLDLIIYICPFRPPLNLVSETKLHQKISPTKEEGSIKSIC